MGYMADPGRKKSRVTFYGPGNFLKNVTPVSVSVSSGVGVVSSTPVSVSVSPEIWATPQPCC
jgi:hypothetical protein